MRTARVFAPRRTSQASSGPGTPPAAFWMNASFSRSASSVPTSAPPTTSLWPPMYFVVECRTMSAPRPIGCCRYGLANVLSTTASAPALCAISATAAMSTTLRSGFVGLSIHTSFVRLRIALATSRGSRMSTGVISMPTRSYTRAKRRYVPPYTSSPMTT